MQNTCVVSVGRPTKTGRILTDVEWENFSFRLYRIAMKVGPVYFDGYGTGLFEGEEEESYTVVVGGVVDYRDLLPLIEAYEQDSIAVTMGQTVLVRP